MIGDLAGAQLGNVTRAQLIAAGVGPDAIDHWLRCGRLRARHRGVYALAHLSLPPFSAELAAVLAAGERALLSHVSAACLWGIRGAPTDIVHVTVVGRQARDRRGIRVHRLAEPLDALDIRKRHAIPVTSPARTLIDIAPALGDRELELALHEALATRLLTMHRMRATLERYPRRRGGARLADLARDELPTTVTNRGAEEELHRLIRRSGLPQPRVNARIGRWSVDFYWPRQRLVVEVDGGDFHSTRPQIERDHRKDLDLRKIDTDVLRFTGRQVRREPELTLVTIAQTLATRV